MDVKPNEPLLADVRAPWDGQGWRARDFLKPKNFWRTINYNHRYKLFWAPASLDAWRYRRFLKDLDELCLRSLRSHGALTAKELAGWLNRGTLLRTKPELTGISRISVATAHDWARLAHRRDLVSRWSGEADGARTTRGGSHWELTEQGRQAIHSKVVAFASRLPFASLTTVLVTGGGFVAALRWLSLHQAVIVLAVYGVFVTLALTGLRLWFSRSEKRENPGIAVVAVETVRSAGKPIPSI